MTRIIQSFITAFIFMASFRLVKLHFVMREGELIKNPCRRNFGVEWVRDPDSCKQYYICVTGRPMKMPPCPKDYVWSAAGRNCVPEASHWNDCPEELVQKMLHLKQELPLNDGDDNTTSFSAVSDRMDALVNRLDPVQVRIDNITKTFPNHPCVFSKEEVLLAHPKNCHWYFNCSLNPEADEWKYHEPMTQECKYPTLFSLTTRTCQRFDQVNCGTRNVIKDPCAYRDNICTKAHCRPCNIRLGNCVGKQDGNHSFPLREWSPKYVTCKNEWAVQQHDCSEKTPIFSPKSKQCEILHNVPKHHGGLQPVCKGRHDGLHPDEMGRCDHYFECRDGKFVDFSTCANGRMFDAHHRECRQKNVAPPCGNFSTNLCQGHKDGMYADPYGRCPMYYHCKSQRLLGYLKCPFGSFSPTTQQCEMKPDVPAPCGIQENLCYKKQDGAFPDLKKNCMSYFRCKGNYTTLMKTCPNGLVFNHITGDCDDANNTPPPCGMAPSCFGREDGRYSSPLKGCQYYFTCKNGLFEGYTRCSLATGGFYFNPQSQKCDFPKNICGTCGFKEVNCSQFKAFPL